MLVRALNVILRLLKTPPTKVGVDAICTWVLVPLVPVSLNTLFYQHTLYDLSESR